MGAGQSHPYMQINVATLNYSGIIKSPYQFYQYQPGKDTTYQINQDQKQQQQLNKIIEQQLFNEGPGSKQKRKFNLKFQFGPLDAQWQQKRFSPLYVPTCGIKNKVHLMNQQQFRAEWKVWYQRSKAEVKSIFQDWEKKKKQKYDQQKRQGYLNNLEDFDFFMYYVILKRLYNTVEEANQIQKNFRIKSKSINSDEKNMPVKNQQFQLDAKKYKQNRKIKFNRDFLHESERIKKTMQLFHNLNIDILFLQQVTKVCLQQIQKMQPNIRIVKSTARNSKQLKSKSAILIREDSNKFPKLTSLLQQNTRFTTKLHSLGQFGLQQKLNLNKDTVIQFLYNLILICPHLSSKKEKNKDQLNQLKGLLFFFKQKFPDCHVILAGDLNCSQLFLPFDRTLQTKQKDRAMAKTFKFNVIPKAQDQITTNKIRTKMQAQISKTEKDSKVKDYIISDLEIKDGKIIIAKDCKVVIDMDNPSEKKVDKMPLLPSNDHPFDHYLVFGKIILHEQLVHVTDFQYRYQYNSSALTQQELKNLQTKVKEMELTKSRRA